jgi:transposase
MRRFIKGTDRTQGTLFPDYLDEWVDENELVQVIDAFVDELDLRELGFDGVTPEATGRPSYHPSVLLKLYIYGYLNRVQSSRRFEREARRNVELMWLTGRLVPDHKTIADFRENMAPPFVPSGAALSCSLEDAGSAALSSSFSRLGF